jgi:hypothetical protein
MDMQSKQCRLSWVCRREPPRAPSPARPEASRPPPPGPRTHGAIANGGAGRMPAQGLADRKEQYARRCGRRARLAPFKLGRQWAGRAFVGAARRGLQRAATPPEALQ